MNERILQILRISPITTHKSLTFYVRVIYSTMCTVYVNLFIGTYYYKFMLLQNNNNVIKNINNNKTSKFIEWRIPTLPHQRSNRATVNDSLLMPHYQTSDAAGLIG